jgi:hypothetical protein
MKENTSTTITAKIPHGMHVGDTLWIDSGNNRYRVMSIDNENSMTIRSWRWYDWIGHIWRKLYEWAKWKWYEAAEIIESWKAKSK